MPNINLAARSPHPQAVTTAAPSQPRRFSAWVLLVGCAMVLLAALAAGNSTSTALAQGTIPPPGGTLPSPVAILLSLGRSGEVESKSGKLAYRDEDIISYTPSTGALDLYFDGSAYGLQALDLRDFEILADGGFLFTGNKPFTIENPNGTLPPLAADDSDIVRYHPITDSFSIYLRGADIGLTRGGEDIDALAFAPDGRLLISTIGTARVNGPNGEVAARDEDLLACDLTATPKSCVLYFDGSDVRLTRGNEDIMAAWVDPAGTQPHFLTTKGRYKAEGSLNQVDEDREVVFACTPITLEESGDLTDCNFELFFDSEAELDSEKQIDGLWMGAPISPTLALRRDAGVNYDLVREAALDNEELAEGAIEEDEEIDAYDFVIVTQELYLPVIER